jgi:cytoskeletal protein CcmA (bactofilin family)
MTMATRADVAGTGSVTADLQGSKLTVKGSFSGLASAATKAQLRSGSMTGVPGEPFADLTVAQMDAGTLTGTVTLNRAQQKALLAGAIYVQIDSVKAPDGTLRAWLLSRQP